MALVLHESMHIALETPHACATSWYILKRLKKLSQGQGSSSWVLGSRRRPGARFGSCYKRSSRESDSHHQ
jgi:hypothetical protein